MMPKLVFKTAVTWTGNGGGSVATVNGKNVNIDGPLAIGGKEEGPNPMEFLLLALGGCVNSLVVNFAPHHQVEVRSIHTSIEGDLDPAGYREETQGVRPGFQEIRYQTHIDSPSPAAKVQALLEHCVRVCPVKDTLQGVPIVNIDPPASILL